MINLHSYGLYLNKSRPSLHQRGLTMIDGVVFLLQFMLSSAITCIDPFLTLCINPAGDCSSAHLREGRRASTASGYFPEGWPDAGRVKAPPSFFSLSICVSSSASSSADRPSLSLFLLSLFVYLSLPPSLPLSLSLHPPSLSPSFSLLFLCYNTGIISILSA